MVKPMVGQVVHYVPKKLSEFEQRLVNQNQEVWEADRAAVIIRVYPLDILSETAKSMGIADLQVFLPDGRFDHCLMVAYSETPKADTWHHFKDCEKNYASTTS